MEFMTIMKFIASNNRSLRFARENKIINRAFRTVALCLVLCAALGAAAAPGSSVKKMLHRVTGITEDDVAAARAAKELALFDAFALSVFNTETMAIEGENSVQAALQREQAIHLLPAEPLPQGEQGLPGAEEKLYVARKLCGKPERASADRHRAGRGVADQGVGLRREAARARAV